MRYNLLLYSLIILLLSCKGSNSDPSPDPAFYFSEFEGVFLDKVITLTENNTSVWNNGSIVLLGNEYLVQTSLKSIDYGIGITVHVPTESTTDEGFQIAAKRIFTEGIKSTTCNQWCLYFYDRKKYPNPVLLESADNAYFEVVKVREIPIGAAVKEILSRITPAPDKSFLITLKIKGEYGVNGKIDGLLTVKIVY